MQFSFFLGIDMSKEWLDAAIIAANSPKAIANKRFENTPEGFKAFLKWLKTHASKQLDKVFICMEHTGVYTVPFCCFLEEKGLQYTLVPGLAIKRSSGMTRGKNDKIDALRIAQYIRKNYEEVELFTLPILVLRELKALIAFRKRLMKAKHAFEVSAKELKKFEQEQVSGAIDDDNQELLKTIKAKIKIVNQKMLHLIQNNPALKRNYDLCVSVTGIGLVTAAHILVYTQNFVAFTDFRKFACYCGIAPFPNSSGKSQNGATKVSHLANKVIKALLANCAHSAMQHSAEIRQYVKRQQGKGKNDNSITNVVKNKLISRVFAAVKRGTPYVPLNKYYTLAKN